MTVHGALEFLTASAVRVEVLSELSQPLREIELLEILSHSTEATQSALEGFEQRSWIRNTNDRYRQTAGGAVIVRILDNLAASDAIEEEPTTEESRERLRKDLNLLINPPRRARMLQADTLPSSPTDLGKQYGTDPSLGNRDAEKLTSRGWYKKNGLSYKRTEKGEALITGYEYLCRAIEQIAKKQPLIYRLSSENGDLPAAKLSDAELVDASQDGPDAGIAGLRKIGRNVENSPIEQIRTVCPVHKPSMGDVFRDFVSFKTEMKLVYDQPTFRQMCRPTQIPILCAIVAHPYTNVRVHSSALSFGVGLYDDQGMVMAYNGYPGNEAGIITTNKDLTEWIDATFKSYWQQSEPLSAEFAERIRRYADESIWSMSDITFWTGDKDDGEGRDGELYRRITR
jgi:predicted transcriptional regulator